jgi:hypothetical protein
MGGQLGLVECPDMFQVNCTIETSSTRPVIPSEQRYVSNPRELLLLSNPWACGPSPTAEELQISQGGPASLSLQEIELLESRADKLYPTATWRVGVL